MIANRYIETFLDQLKLEKNYSNHTIRNYQQDLYKFATFFDLNQNKWNDVQSRHCRQYLYMLENSAYAKKSIQRHISALRSFWVYLIAQNQCTNNPWKHIKTAKAATQLPYIINKTDMNNFLTTLQCQTATDIRNKSICELLYSTGLRVSELCSIKLTRINWPLHEIKIQGKGNHERLVLFGSHASHWLSLYIEKTRKKWGSSQTDTLYLNKYGGPLTERTIQRLLKKESQRQGLKNPITPHTLRHCFATDLYEGGADLSTIQHLLGHKSLNSTQLYTHLSTKHLKEVIKNCLPRN